MKPELFFFFSRGFKCILFKYILCFSSSDMSESPTHFCKVQWDCWLISVQPYSQSGKSLADESQTPEWASQPDGETLVSFSWKHRLLHSSHQLVHFLKLDKILPAKMTEQIDWILLNYKQRSLPQSLRNKLFLKTDSLIFPAISANPPQLSQWPVTLASGLKQRLSRLFLPPGGNTTLSNSFLLLTNTRLLR